MDGLSVVIPIYNVETYLAHCLRSVLDSMGDRGNIQLILVDDGSTDQSGEIARKYAQKYEQIEYVYKENGGLSDARNYGLQFIHYQHVTFLDSDDYVDISYFSEVMAALKSDPDLVIFDWMDVGDDGYKNVVKGIELADEIWTVQPSAWNKVYRATFFQQIKFPKGKLYEDVGTIYKLLYYVKDYVYINKPLYKYRKNRAGSLLTTISPKINDIYEMLEDTHHFYVGNHAFSKKNADGLCYQYIKILMWPNMYRQLKYYQFNFIGFYKKMKGTRELLYKYFYDWKNNPHLKKNSDYFKNRFGNNYVKRMDRLGDSFVATVYTVVFLMARNYRKR